MITTHQFINKYKISNDSEKLIVGTIHPHNHEAFALPFFYGNVNSIWDILSEAFPQELTQPLTIQGVLQFLQNKKISISDTIIKCERKNPTALDQDLIPLELNMKIMDDIKKSKVKEILFTSGFGKNNAFKLFYSNILGKRISKEIKQNRGITLDKSIFGRQIKLTVLYSPSGNSNVGLSKSKLYIANKQKYSYSTRPVQEFKVDYYRNAFS